MLVKEKDKLLKPYVYKHYVWNPKTNKWYRNRTSYGYIRKSRTYLHESYSSPGIRDKVCLSLDKDKNYSLATYDSFVINGKVKKREVNKK